MAAMKILGFRGFDSSIILILRGGIPRPEGNFLEILSQQVLVWTILAGRLGVPPQRRSRGDRRSSDDERGADMIHVRVLL